MVNHQDLAMGVLYLLQDCVLGEITVNDNSFRAEVRGKAQHLAQKICSLYSPGCRAKLGDTECTIDLTDSAGTYTHDGTVTSATDRRQFIDTSTIDSGGSAVFEYGKLTWTGPSSSDNVGLEMEVKSFDPATGEFELFEAMPYTISTSDEFTVTWGCDKQRTTCRDRFDNIVNFRGEPFLPGTIVIDPWRPTGIPNPFN
jgi:uncharacterized phage protein (TIGR02218 family)